MEQIAKVLDNLGSILQNPSCFMSPDETLTETARKHAKVLYDQVCGLSKDDADSSSVPILDELYTNGFDSEQIWQQIDHRLSYQLNKYQCVVDSLKKDESLSLGVQLNSPKPTTVAEPMVESEDSMDASDQSDSVSIDNENEKNGSLTSSQSEDDSSANTKSNSLTEAKSGKLSDGVSDQFFSLKAMEQFLEQQDALLEKDPVLFERQFDELYESDESENSEYNYSDFFGKKSVDNGDTDIDSKRGNFDDISAEANSEDLSDEELELIKVLDKETAENDQQSEADDEDTGDEMVEDGDDLSGDESEAEHLEDIIGKQKNEPAKSEYEKRSEKLKQRIEAMEEEALEDSPWQLKGEITAKHRPENSLIQEDLEFDSNVAPVPVITMETTLNLEKLIIQRIKDKAFNDVERKTRLREDGDRYKKRIDLDHEKSKLSLSQIYEQEYLKLRDKDNEEDKEKEDPEEKEIKDMMKSLFSKLDALSSFRFTPKPAPKEVQILSHLPAVVVEEVQPDTVTDAARLAPEEVKKPKVEVKDRSEMSVTDKKRLRRQKKARGRKVEKFKKSVESNVRKMNPGLGNKRAQQRSIEAIKQAVVNQGKLIKPVKESVVHKKTYSSSKEFFKALQNEVKIDKEVSRKKAITKKRILQKSDKPAEKFKL